MPHSDKVGTEPAPTGGPPPPNDAEPSKLVIKCASPHVSSKSPLSELTDEVKGPRVRSKEIHPNVPVPWNPLSGVPVTGNEPGLGTVHGPESGV